jgi:hypothetical protein
MHDRRIGCYMPSIDLATPLFGTHIMPFLYKRSKNDIYTVCAYITPLLFIGICHKHEVHPRPSPMHSTLSLQSLSSKDPLLGTDADENSMHHHENHREKRHTLFYLPAFTCHPSKETIRGYLMIIGLFIFLLYGVSITTILLAFNSHSSGQASNGK